MRIQHQMILSRFLQTVLIVVIHELGVMMFTDRQDISHVAGFDSRVLVFAHELVGGIKPSLVITDSAGGLVVHDHLHALGFGILMDALHVKIRIGGYEIIDEILLITEPVFPSDIPSLDKDAIEAVFGSKINISLDVLSGRAMPTVGFGFGIIRDADMDRREIPCVAPITHACDHLPPYANILHGLDP